MNEHHKLNETLRKWGGRVDERLSPSPPSFSIPRLSESRMGFREWKYLKGIGIFATALLVVFLAWPRTEPEVTEETYADWVKIYSEISRIFPDQSVWISGKDSDIEMGMERLEPETSGDRFVLRVEIQKLGEDGQWQEVWSRDVVTTETTWVDTVSGDRKDEKLSVWSHSPYKGVLVLESYLDLPQPYEVSTREQVLFTFVDNVPSVSEVPIRPGVRMVQRMMELDSYGEGV